MKRSLFGLLLAAILTLMGFAAAHAQDAPADEPTLRMPRYIAPAYTTLGTRNADGTPGPNYWQNHSVHDIAIEVMPPGRTVTGTQVVTYTNNSPNPLPMIVVRLFQNSRLPEAPREENHTRDFLTDGIQIDEFSVNGQVIPWATFDAILPFETVKLVPLPQPLLPGESTTFTFKWHYDLGLEYNREGVFDPTTFFIGYFFPRIATYSDTDAGLLPGWDLEEYTYRSGRELHNDFADFNYSVTVPKNFLVWATGELQNPDEVLQPDAAQRLLASRTSDEIITVASPDDLQQGLITAQTDTVTWRWQAENITDIALGVSDHYVWDAGSVVADPATDRRVSVHAAYAEAFADFDRMAQDIKEIVAFASSEWPGVPWPYSHANVFVGGGDEEFPMLANDGSESPMEGASVRFIAAHELLHNYFPFYMGIDERRYPFMDEGWTTAFEYLFNLEDIGQEAADALFIKVRSGNLVNPHPGEEIPIIVPADATRGLVTGNDGYEKPALAYLALKEYMGDEAFKSSLHAFMDRWHGKRPLPWDMFNTFSDTADIELNWFFQNWFFESNYLDIAIADVAAVDDGYTIQVENAGGAAIPFDVKVVYADDSAESFRQGPGVWRDSPETVTVTIQTDQELISVTLDGGIFIDTTPADNTWRNLAADPAVTATEPMTTTATVTTTEALTSATLMPNLADYPHLMAAQSFFPDKIVPTIEECISLFSPDAYPRPEPDYTGKQARDLSAFADALADFTPERAAELDGLVPGKTIPQLQALFDDGDLTAEELVLYYVDRIRRYDIDKLNSVLTLNPEALALARTLDAELAAGTVRGAMHGIPVLLKDNIATGDGMHTTAGAAALQDWVPDRDAFLVQQIRAAGGIILGKANLSEWANYNDPCMPSGFSAVGGQTRHPYGPFEPFGSSTGSAVSVAANLTTVSVGSETSGSLIQPSRVNSVVGLRPSQGLISRDYVVPLGAHLDTPGPMGRSLTDVAILLNAMIGVDANDPKTNDAAALANVDFTTYLDLERTKGLRVGVVMFEETIAAQRAAVEEASGETIPEEALPSVISAWVEGNPFQAKAALEAQGITVVELKQADLPPDVDTAQSQLIYGFGADLNAFLAGLSKPAPIGSIADVVAFNEQDMANRAPYNQRFVKWSAESKLPPDEHAQIVAEAQAYANAWMSYMMETYDVDLLIAATKYANNAGAAGIPALTIPAGLDATGKPTGIIITGPYLSEPDLFAVGYALEQALQGRVEPDLDATIQQIAEVTGQ